MTRIRSFAGILQSRGECEMRGQQFDDLFGRASCLAISIPLPAAQYVSA